MSTSVQDIDSRVGVLERKIDFLFKLMTFTKKTPSILNPGEFIIEQVNMEEVYREASTSGGVEVVK